MINKKLKRDIIIYLAFVFLLIIIVFLPFSMLQSKSILEFGETLPLLFDSIFNNPTNLTSLFYLLLILPYISYPLIFFSLLFLMLSKIRISTYMGISGSIFFLIFFAFLFITSVHALSYGRFFELIGIFLVGISGLGILFINIYSTKIEVNTELKLEKAKEYVMNLSTQHFEIPLKKISRAVRINEGYFITVILEMINNGEIKGFIDGEWLQITERSVLTSGFPSKIKLPSDINLGAIITITIGIILCFIAFNYLNNEILRTFIGAQDFNVYVSTTLFFFLLIGILVIIVGVIIQKINR